MALRELPARGGHPAAADPSSSRQEPFALFRDWYEEARRAEPNDPDAMSLATVDGQGLPNVRMVLLKSFDERGFVFYTNLESQKGAGAVLEPQGGAVFSLEIAAPPGQGARAGRAGCRGRGRRVFRLAAAREPDRRLGLQAVAAARKPVRSRKSGGQEYRPVRRRRGAEA